MEVLEYIIPVGVIIGIPAFLSFLLSKALGKRALLTGLGLFALLGAGLLIASSAVGGYGGIGYFVAALLGVAPASVAYLVGGLAGLARREPISSKAQPLLQ